MWPTNFLPQEKGDIAAKPETLQKRTAVCSTYQVSTACQCILGVHWIEIMFLHIFNFRSWSMCFFLFDLFVTADVLSRLRLCKLWICSFLVYQKLTISNYLLLGVFWILYMSITCWSGSNNILKMASFLQQRCFLDDKMEKLLSAIDLSRTTTVANFSWAGSCWNIK